MIKSDNKLIYIPSHAVLLNGKNPTKIEKLKKPGVFLVVSSTETCFGIIYQGSQWLVNKKCSYQVQEGDQG